MTTAMTCESIHVKNGAFLHTTRSATVADSALMVGTGFSDQEWKTILGHCTTCFDADDNSGVELEELFLSLRMIMENGHVPEGALIQVFLSRYDSEANRLYFFNCGLHSLLYYNNELSDITGLNITDLPLGARESAIYEQHELPVESADMIHIMVDEHQFTLHFDVDQEQTCIMLQSDNEDRLPPRTRSRHVLGALETGKL